MPVRNWHFNSTEKGNGIFNVNFTLKYSIYKIKLIKIGWILGKSQITSDFHKGNIYR